MLSNPLHYDTFIFTMKMETEVIKMTANYFFGTPETCGVMTDGGKFISKQIIFLGEIVFFLLKTSRFLETKNEKKIFFCQKMTEKHLRKKITYWKNECCFIRTCANVS
jgi:hypothetical protein